MKVELKSVPFLELPKLVELAANAVAIRDRTAKAIARLNGDVEKQKTTIGNRWRDVGGVTMQDRQRLAMNETAAAVSTIRQNASAELTGLMCEAVENERAANAQAVFWDSPVKVLAREGLGTDARGRYQQQLAGAGTMELAHVGQLAVSTKNRVLAAAVLAVLDSLARDARPFDAAALAQAVVGDDYDRAQQAILVVRNRAQQVVVMIRAFNSARGAPVAAVASALSRAGEDGSISGEIGEK